MKFLWFRCDIIIPGTALAVFVIALALGGYLLQRELETTPDLDKHCSMASDSVNNIERFKGENHSAFVVGYTGEVGKALVRDLNKQKIFKKVLLIGRREVPLDVGPEFEQKIVDFDNLEEHKDLFNDLDVGFCCLGTTHAKSGTQGFIKVDHDYVMHTARTAKSNGCKQFSLVSSQGADKSSRFLYPRTKGQVEEALKEIKFDRLSVYRPGMLICEREERRTLEVVFGFLLKPVFYLFPTAISTPVEVVARAMINHIAAPLGSQPEATTYENKAVHAASGISSGCRK